MMTIKMDLPKIDLPGNEIPQFEIPEFPQFEALEIPQFEIPKLPTAFDLFYAKAVVEAYKWRANLEVARAKYIIKLFSLGTIAE